MPACLGGHDRGLCFEFVVPIDVSLVVGFVSFVGVLVVEVLVVGVLVVGVLVVGVLVVRVLVVRDDDLDVVVDVLVFVVGVEIDFVLIRFIEVVVLEFFVGGLDPRRPDGVRIEFGDFLGRILALVIVLVFVTPVGRGHRLEHRMLTGRMHRHRRDGNVLGPAALLAALAAAPT